ncbi:ATP-binding protein [Apilactobacillus ozensis]|uniref:ATP-binding protein n=1 Tax=Apilactobacillus ozensis TaxID=866801 RepID=UPI00200A8163|nr:ATP-binding protein [Apilactobacillus ozensis]MCK8606702.1 ATP-binding protein [Apilactobacillus ozensis]
MPRIFMEINLINSRELDIVLDVKDSEISIDDCSSTYLKSISIGKSVIFDNYDVKVNLNKFFGHHFAVLGNTGSGKSNTIAHTIQKIFSKKNKSAVGAHILVVDSNGEYDKSFKNISKNNKNINYKNICVSPDDFQLPIWALSNDDWAILLNASDKTQVPIINKAMQLVKISSIEDSDERDSIYDYLLSSIILGILGSPDLSGTKGDKIKSILSKFSGKEIRKDMKISFKDSNKNYRETSLIRAVTLDFGNIPCYEELVNLCQENLEKKSHLDRLDSIDIPHYGIQEFQEAMELAIAYDGSINNKKIYEFTAPMISRLDYLKNSQVGKIFSVTDFSSTDDFIDNIVTKYQLTNFDLSHIDDSSAEVILRVISKMLLEFQKNNKHNKKLYPINIIIEEAHRYIYSKADFSFDIFERIAKEGRKFELLLGISSQRPSELSKTVVSQCSNFIVHRIQNPDDLYYISKMIPNANREIMNRLTYLNTGSALIFGSSINIPTLTRFDIAVPSTDSSSANISKKWFDVD